MTLHSTTTYHSVHPGTICIKSVTNTPRQCTWPTNPSPAVATCIMSKLTSAKAITHSIFQLPYTSQASNKSCISCTLSMQSCNASCHNNLNKCPSHHEHPVSNALQQCFHARIQACSWLRQIPHQRETTPSTYLHHMSNITHPRAIRKFSKTIHSKFTHFLLIEVKEGKIIIRISVKKWQVKQTKNVHGAIHFSEAKHDFGQTWCCTNKVHYPLSLSSTTNPRMFHYKNAPFIMKKGLNNIKIKHTQENLCFFLIHPRNRRRREVPKRTNLKHLHVTFLAIFPNKVAW